MLFYLSLFKCFMLKHHWNYSLNAYVTCMGLQWLTGDCQHCEGWSTIKAKPIAHKVYQGKLNFNRFFLFLWCSTTLPSFNQLSDFCIILPTDKAHLHKALCWLLPWWMCAHIRAHIHFSHCCFTNSNGWNGMDNYFMELYTFYTLAHIFLFLKLTVIVTELKHENTLSIDT